MSWCSESSRWPSKTLSARVSGRPSRRRTIARLRSMVSYTFAATSAVDSIVTIADVLRPQGRYVCLNGVCHQLRARYIVNGLDRHPWSQQVPFTLNDPVLARQAPGKDGEVTEPVESGLILLGRAAQRHARFGAHCQHHGAASAEAGGWRCRHSQYYVASVQAHMV